MNNSNNLNDHFITVIDGAGDKFGRVCSRAAMALMGKHDPLKADNLGKYKVVIKNANKLVLTGKKFTDKRMYRHSGYPGGIKYSTPKEMVESGRVDRFFRNAIRRMLPKNTSVYEQALKTNLIIEK